jgi:hypothetical protein
MLTGFSHAKLNFRNGESILTGKSPVNSLRKPFFTGDKAILDGVFPVNVFSSHFGADQTSLMVPVN